MSDLNGRGLQELFKSAPIPEDEMLRNLPLFTGRINLADQLFMVELYKMSMETHGVVAEFGCRWGRNLALFCALRSIFEPYNHIKKIIGFDTFEGFPSVSKMDGSYVGVVEKGFSATKNYEHFLDEIMLAHEATAPISSKRKFELVKGDIKYSLPKYLEEHPETIFSLVYVDVDLYEPTKDILTYIKPHLVKGSIIGFDEVCHPHWPGETRALKEVLGVNNVRLKKFPWSPATSYLVWE